MAPRGQWLPIRRMIEKHRDSSQKAKLVGSNPSARKYFSWEISLKLNSHFLNKIEENMKNVDPVNVEYEPCFS